MTETNRDSALKIQEISRKIEEKLQFATDDDNKIDIIKLVQTSVNLSRIIGLFLATNTWSSNPREFSRNVAQLLAARDSSNDISIALEKFEKEFFVQNNK